MTGFTLWLTGLPGAGKSTFARGLAEALLRRGYAVEVLRSGALRPVLSPEADYAEAGRLQHALRLAWAARLLNRNGVICVVDGTSPRASLREEVRLQVGELVEVYLKTPRLECERRSPAGYARAEAGQWPHFPGVGLAFEPPAHAELAFDAQDPSWHAEILETLNLLELLDYIQKNPDNEAGDAAARQIQDDARVLKRLEELGYA